MKQAGTVQAAVGVVQWTVAFKIVQNEMSQTVDITDWQHAIVERAESRSDAPVDCVPFVRESQCRCRLGQQPEIKFNGVRSRSFPSRARYIQLARRSSRRDTGHVARGRGGSVYRIIRRATRRARHLSFAHEALQRIERRTADLASRWHHK